MQSHLRWLLVMEMLSDDITDRKYRLWLNELDGPSDPAACSFDTLDDLLNALLARWEHPPDYPAASGPGLP